MRKLIFTTTAAAVVLGASAASAEPRLGYKGDAALSADRMMGLTWTRDHTERPGRDDNVDHSGFSFGWRSRVQQTPFDAPRLAFDYFIIDSLSLGGSLGFVSYGGDDPHTEHFLLHPRVGYMFGISDTFGFWLRGGLTYHSVNGPGNGDEDGLAFTAEGMFAVTPVDHFGFTFGPTFDADFTGGRGDNDHSYRSFGINFGLVGWF